MSSFADADGYYEFTLDGHTYTGHLLDAEAGFDLAVQLSSALVDPLCAILGPPLLRALASPEIIASFQDAMKGGDDDFLGAFLGADAGALAEAADAIDPTQVARGIQQVMRSLDLKTVKAILADTHRNGRPLNTTSGFNQAFRGNYVEAFKAAAKVARGNGFLPELGTIVASLSGAAAKAPSGSAGFGASSSRPRAEA